MDEFKSNGLEKKVDIQFSHSHRKTKKLLQFEHVSFSYDQKKIIQDFSTTVSSKMKVGVLGTNGVGKSSLFKLILSELKPQSGKITLAHDLSVVYFDQNKTSSSSIAISFPSLYLLTNQQSFFVFVAFWHYKLCLDRILFGCCCFLNTSKNYRLTTHAR